MSAAMTQNKIRATTIPPDTADTDPGFVAAAAVKPREATPAGGLGLTAVASTQAQSESVWANLLGNDSQPAAVTRLACSP